VIYDSVIVGGGIAGLQAAIQLGRSRRHVLVVDDGKGRSSLAKNYRNILGFPDGVSGLYLRMMGTQQAKRVGVEFLADRATEIRQDEEGIFHISTQKGATAYAGRTLLLATGMTDAIPLIPGLSDCLGESVYICPDCDGYEVLSQKTAVIGSGPHAAHLALILKYFTDELLVINHTKEEMDAELSGQLKAENITVMSEKVIRIEQEKGQLQAIQLENGNKIAVEKGFVAFRGAVVNTGLLDSFPLNRLSNGHIIVDGRTKETSYPNIWAVGDVAAHSQMSTIAMGDGAQAAIWIHKRLFELAGKKSYMNPHTHA